MWIITPAEGYLTFDGVRWIGVPFDFAIAIFYRDVLVYAKSEAGIERVDFYVDDQLKGTVETGEYDNYRWWWNETAFGMHEISATAYDNTGNNASDAVNVFYFNP